MTNRLIKTAPGVGTRGPEAKRSIQLKLCISPAVSKIAGMTIENEIVQSRLNRNGLGNSRPTYSQFAVRTLISSNNHHTGAESRKSRTKFFRERDQIELPAREHRPLKCIQAKVERTGKPCARLGAASSGARKPPPGPVPASRVPAKLDCRDSFRL